MGWLRLVACDEIVSSAGTGGDIAGVGLAADGLESRACFGGGEVACKGDFGAGGEGKEDEKQGDKNPQHFALQQWPREP